MGNLVSDAMLSLLVADAIGVPYEFGKPQDVSLLTKEGVAVGPARRAHRGTPPGTWSDDGAQALCLAASLSARTGIVQFDKEDFASRLQAWWREGYLAVDARVFDIGNSTLRALETGEGRTEEDSQGNGSLMRTLPLALWHDGSSDADLVQDAAAASSVTHQHPNCMAACGLYCLLVQEILERGVERAWDRACVRFQRVPGPRRGFVETLPEVPRGSGYVLDSLAFARDVVLNGWSYEETVLRAIALGDDTDTTAAIGAPIAFLCGSGIPEMWLKMLRGRDLCDPVLNRFDAVCPWE